MKKKVLEKRYALWVMLLVFLLSVNLSACGKADGFGSANVKSDEIAGAQKGGYAETAVELPEGIYAADIAQIGKDDGKLYFLEKKAEEGCLVFREYMLETEGFREVEQEWLNTLAIPENVWSMSYGHCPIKKEETAGVVGEGARAFLFAQFEGEDDYIGHLYITKDGETAIEITPQSWKELLDFGGYEFYDYPTVVEWVDDNTLAGWFYDRLEFYRADTGTLIKQIPFSGSYIEKMAVAEDGVYILTASDMGSFNGVEKYQTEQEAPVETIPFTEKADYTVNVDVLADGTIIVATGEGFYQWKPEASDWEKIIPAEATSLGMATMWCRDIVALESGIFYGLFGADEEAEAALMEYVYDPDLEIAAEQILTIYTVNESPVLKQAAALFQKENPGVRVEVETELTYEEMYGDVDMNSIYSALNAKIIAGEAADILVLDGMNMESFIEKNLLLDIHDVITPMEEQKEILTNITGGYQKEDGSRYIVPLRFALTMLVGRGVDVEHIQNLELMAKQFQTYDKSVLGVRTVEDLVAEFAPFFTDEIVKNKELDKEALKTYLEYLKVIADNCGIVSDYGGSTRSPGIWEIASSVYGALYETGGFNQSMLPVSAAKLVNGNFTCFENAFTPKVQVGIYSQTKEPELAKEFLRFSLSFEVQKSDFYDGFPVNVEALETQARKDRSDAMAYTTIVVGDGSSSEFEIGDLDEEQAKAVVEMCKQVNNQVVWDEEINQKIAEAIPGYLEGNRSLEETIEQIAAGLRMYLAE